MTARSINPLATGTTGHRGVCATTAKNSHIEKSASQVRATPEEKAAVSPTGTATGADAAI